MSRGTRRSGEQRSGDYEVGYGRPPKHTRFKKGQSGNPRGRPKGAKNLATDLAEELKERIVIREGDTIKRVSKQRAAIKSLVAKAAKGDHRALGLLLPLAERYLVNQLEAQINEELSGSDAEIIERFFERWRASRPAEDARAGKPAIEDAPAGKTSASLSMRRTRFPGKSKKL